MLCLPEIQWDVTLNCNLTCRHCSMGRQIVHHDTHPPLDTAVSIARRLHRGAVSQVALLGGEPLSYPGILDVLRLMKEQGVFVTINSNGLLLNLPLLDLVRGNFGWSIMISLDGPDAETHEMIRGKGTFKATMEKLHLARRCREGTWPHLGIACTLNKATIGRIPEMVCLSQQLEVDLLQLRLVQETGNAARHFDGLR